jgi:hypothetical protein
VGVKKAEFYAEFEIRRKNTKEVYMEKVIER